MVWKKNIVCYLAWGLYVVLMIIGLFWTASLTGIRMKAPAWIGLVLSGIVLTITLALCLCFCSRRKLHAETVQNEKGIPDGIVNAGIAAVVVTSGVLIRILEVRNAVSTGYGADNFYYLNAAGLADGASVSFVHGAEQIHVWLLAKCMAFFQIHPVTAYLALIAEQALSAIFLFSAAALICGTVPALCGILFFCFSPAAGDQILTMSPEILFTFGAAIGVLLMAFMIRGRRFLPVKAFLAGFFAGVMSYLDICAAGLLSFLAGRIGLIGKEKEKKKNGAVYGAVGLSGAMAGFFSVLVSDAVYSGGGIRMVPVFFKAWSSVYGQAGTAKILEGTLLLSHAGMIWLWGLVILSCVGAGSFFSESEDRGRKLWTLGLIFFIIPDLFGIASEECRAEGMVLFCAAVLAGLGVKTIMALKYFAKKPENGEQDNSIHPSWDQEETGMKTAEKESQDKESTEKVTSGKEVQDVKTQEKGTPGKLITVNNEDGSSRQVRLLDNPMKVPPKHAHKSLDYDIDVSEDDDFDI